ncbi:MAG: hypothetical protein AAB316_06270, partial [Bacteroidota bacterium]
MCPIEVILPCPPCIDCCVNTCEEGDHCCCPGIDDPNIVSPKSKYIVKFHWNTNGSIFGLVGPTENWLV